MAYPTITNIRRNAYWLRVGPDESGFTLIELLVVLAVMALLIAVAPTFLETVAPEFRMRAAARDLASELQRARDDAVTKQATVAVVFDLAAARYAREGASKSHVLPSSLDLVEVSVPPNLRDGHTAWIRFYPDGSATGAAISLTTHAHQATVIVNWLTGKVSIDG